MATAVRAPIQGAGTPAMDNRQSAGIRSARRSSSSSSSSPREHRRSGRRKRDRHVSKQRSYRSRSSRRSRRSRASQWRSPSSSGSSSGRSHRQESSRHRSIHRMERQGPMTPVAREASCPDTGAPIGAHLDSAIKEHIWANDFIDIWSLVSTDQHSVDRERRLGDKTYERKPKVAKTINNWLQALRSWDAIYWDGAFRNPWRRWIVHIRSGMSWGPDAINTLIDLLADGKPVGSSEDARMQ
ncbi:unnamed protein product, partial [Ranitomeya imitator]